jgi:mannose-6-phosphate isomerase-like protein (cupin superfamily)
MEEVDLKRPSELATLINSRFEDTPKYRKDVKKFSYERPVLKAGKKRAGVRLSTTDILFAVIQVFESGGENVMHSHAGMDGFWMVLSGRARFYLENDEVVEMGPLEGLTIPRGVKYWFETVGDQPLEILQVDAIHPQIKNSLDVVAEHAHMVAQEEAALAMFDAQDK